MEDPVSKENLLAGCVSTAHRVRGLLAANEPGNWEEPKLLVQPGASVASNLPEEALSSSPLESLGAGLDIPPNLLDE